MYYYYCFFFFVRADNHLCFISCCHCQFAKRSPGFVIIPRDRYQQTIIGTTRSSRSRFDGTITTAVLLLLLLFPTNTVVFF